VLGVANFGLDQTNTSLIDIVDMNAKFRTNGGQPLSIKVLSNITLEFARDIFELPFRRLGFDVKLFFSDTSDLLTAADEIEETDVVILFYEFANLTEGFHIKINQLNDDQLDAYTETLVNRLEYIATRLKNSKFAIVNKITPMLFQSGGRSDSARDNLCELLNEKFKSPDFENVKIVDIERVIGRLGHQRSVNWREFYSSQALYTIDFIKEYITVICPMISGNIGIRKKLIILDCDNTLWHGILGEDGPSGIKMSQNDPVGKIYAEVQSLLVSLKNYGMILAICSKNNEKDVVDFLRSSSDAIITLDDIVAKRINWSNKADNIKEILLELNIGADSAIFIDDSLFELENVSRELPQLLCLKVPDKIYNYPDLLRKLSRMLQVDEVVWEDANKTELYLKNTKRDLHKSHFSNHDEYLLSLGMRCSTCIDDRRTALRISQLTQKTNQFNLTTKRYTQAEVNEFIESDKYVVFSYDAKDKFGDYGIIAVIIVEFDREVKFANIDTFLMSCRIIGRKLEYQVLQQAINYLEEYGCTRLHAKYIPTSKNGLVADLYDKAWFDVISNDEFHKIYEYRTGKNYTDYGKYWKEEKNE